MLPIIAIVGPTAVGKTELSISLAKHFHGEIINADSMQVYRGLNIGTAKVTEEEKEEIPHHLFDICDVEENYTVFQYQRDARKKIEEIYSRGHVPIFVGGTGLYLKAALYQYEFEVEETSIPVTHLTNEELFSEIIQHNGNSSIHINNRKRLERAYQKLSNHTKDSNKGNIPLYDFICIGLTTDREELYQRINRRVISMIEKGLIEEAKAFYDQKIYSKALMTGIGYKELYEYFSHEKTLEEVIDLIQKNSRHYAKRQYTFFRHQLPVHWIETNYEHFDTTIQQAIDYINKNNKN